MFPLKVGIFLCHFFDYQMVTPPPRHSKSTCRSPNILALTLIWSTKDIWYCTLCEENGGQPSISFGRYPIFNQPHVYMTHWPPIVKRRILDLRSEEGWSVPYRANRGRRNWGVKQNLSSVLHMLCSASIGQCYTIQAFKGAGKNAQVICTEHIACLYNHI